MKRATGELIGAVVLATFACVLLWAIWQDHVVSKRVRYTITQIDGGKGVNRWEDAVLLSTYRGHVRFRTNRGQIVEIVGQCSMERTK